MYYIAFFDPGKGGKFDVTFPQFPGCVSQGDDFADAQRMAAEALALHVEGMREDGEPIPDPAKAGKAIAAYYADPANAGNTGIIPVAIPLLSASGKSVRIQVTIDEFLLRRIDAVSRNRSAFLADAAMQRLHGL